MMGLKRHILWKELRAASRQRFKLLSPPYMSNVKWLGPFSRCKSLRLNRCLVPEGYNKEGKCWYHRCLRSWCSLTRWCSVKLRDKNWLSVRRGLWKSLRLYPWTRINQSRLTFWLLSHCSPLLVFSFKPCRSEQSHKRIILWWHLASSSLDVCMEECDKLAQASLLESDSWCQSLIMLDTLKARQPCFVFASFRRVTSHPCSC